jgi:hypothetical protein
MAESKPISSLIASTSSLSLDTAGPPLETEHDWQSFVTFDTEGPSTPRARPQGTVHKVIILSYPVLSTGRNAGGRY